MLKFFVDSITRYVHISYEVPGDVSDEVKVICKVKRSDSDEILIPSVLPYISDTAKNLMSTVDWDNGMLKGSIIERHAQGLMRRLVWNPFFRFKGVFSGTFYITLYDNDKKVVTYEKDINLDNSDVLAINDWNNVVQRDLVSENPEDAGNRWWYRTETKNLPDICGDSVLEAKEKGIELPRLTYPLNLKGYYAVFVSTPPKLGAIELRFTGDDRTDIFSGSRVGKENFWRWSDLTRQHLVIKQPYRTVYEYEEEYRAYLDTVRFVPLSEEDVCMLNEKWGPGKDKRMVAGYFEPYSWAFCDKLEKNIQHLEPLTAFKEAHLDIIDIQYGRGGSKCSNETRVGDQLIKDTFGDPVRGKVPRTSNVGRMQQYTNTLGTELRFAKMLDMEPFACIGATNCYVGTPLESDFSKKHPEWRIGSGLRYDVPEVRKHILSLIEEAVDIGARGVSVDWCRYPHSVRSSKEVTAFFRELRLMTEKYSKGEDKVKILTRFPARGVAGWQHMDYATWSKEGLIDYLCPSNIQGRHMNFDLKEYVNAVKDTNVKLLPCVDGLSWGRKMPGMHFDRIIKCYEDGADGIYVYQCDGPVLGSAENRRYITFTGYPDKLFKWRDEERKKQSIYSKNIYITPPYAGNKYPPYVRLRVWCEGFEPTFLEMYLDGELINKYDNPPYVFVSEKREDDNAIRPGEHTLLIRAKNLDQWIEREFKVNY